MNSSLWLIAYDIADPGRLREVARALEDRGRRLQQSVFLCDLTGEAFAELRDYLLEDCINPDTDRLAVLPVCARCRDALEQHGVAQVLPGSTETLVV